MRIYAPIVAIALCTTGCANAQKNAMVAASVTKHVATESHEIWSSHLNEKVDECDPESNSEIKTEADFDVCLGVFANNDDVVIALEIYKKAAESLFEILKSPEPQEELLRQLRQQVVDAAWTLLDKMKGMEDGAFDSLKKQLGSTVGR